MKAPPLLILGTTAFATEIAVVAEESGRRIAGFVENLDRTRCSETLEGLPVHWIDDVAGLKETHEAVCGLGTTRRSIFTEQAVERGLRFTTVIHPTAHVSTRTTIGEGSVVGAGVVAGAHTTVGRHVQLNRGSLIGHHTTIGDHTSVSPGANIAGSCEIGRGVFIGMGAIVIDHLSIGDESVVGAGAVVVADVPANVQVVGAPARIVKEESREGEAMDPLIVNAALTGPRDRLTRRLAH